MAKELKRNQMYEEILDILKKVPFATVDYLATTLYISASSVRRYLAELEARSLVVRSYGGVSLNVADNRNIPFVMRMKMASQQKKQIAQKAAELIKDGDTLFVDSSTTCMYLADVLALKRGITVITNGINLLHYLQNFNVRVVCTGGIIDHDDRSSLVGNEAVRRLSEMRANIAFFAPQSIDKEGNCFDCYPEVVAVVQHMMRSADQIVCLCDSTKIGKTSSFKQAELSQIHTLVSDISQEDIFKKSFPNVKFL